MSSSPAPRAWRYYECCQVLGNATKYDMCWFCGEHVGVNYYEEFAEVPFTEHPYRENSSRSYMQASQVKGEFRNWPHP